MISNARPVGSWPRTGSVVAHVTDGLTAASQRHMGIVCDALTHVAIGVGNIIGVAIRLGHRDIGRSEPKPSIETATPVRGIQAVGPTR
jgi:hypothetical protein